MIKYLDSKLVNFFTRASRNNQNQLIKKMISNSCFELISSELSNGKFIPYNTWSISPTAMLTIINYIIINNVKTIVEFGSGISTIFLTNLAKKNNLDLKIISVDHDMEWQEKIKKNYELNNVEFLFCPLDSEMNYKEHKFLWYNLKNLNHINKSEVDFIIIDGPIGNQSDYQRAGAFEYFKSELKRDNFSCFLDDINQGPLEKVMLNYFPDAKLYDSFSIAYSKNKYVADPVIFIK